MKKTIGKPENWQDFESLCKKLWGEIWQIPDEIKKNGRLGQVQSGVDVSGIPKHAAGYWGIQCKGKDDYTNAKLTEQEVLSEIEKAKIFKPSLEVYIIATTSNKDSKIEEFVRVKGLENQNAGSFKIILYCWEDIVDLLEDYPVVLNWYMNGIGLRNKYDFTVLFNNFKDHLILNPIYKRLTVKSHCTIKTNSEVLASRFSELNKLPNIYHLLEPSLTSQVNNKSWVSFNILLENSGSTVIEDWSFNIKFKKGVAKLKSVNSIWSGDFDLSIYVDDPNKTITYSPVRNVPLVQKDNTSFKVTLLPKIKSEIIIADWEIIARDFSTNGKVEIQLQPQFVDVVEYKEVAFNTSEECKKDTIDIQYLIE